MTGISLNLQEDLSKSLADPAKTNGQTTTYLAMDVLRDYIEHEQALTAQIELAVKEADQGNFATDDQVAAMRARRIAVAQRLHPFHRNRPDAAQGLESS